jgi:hypothetical protein
MTQSYKTFLDVIYANIGVNPSFDWVWVDFDVKLRQKSFMGCCPGLTQFK